METASVSVRHVYGSRKVYPVGDFALLLADVAGTKQLALGVLTAVLARGHRVAIVDTLAADAAWLRSQINPPGSGWAPQITIGES